MKLKIDIINGTIGEITMNRNVKGGRLVQYPKKMMKTTELVRECGYTYKYLLRMAHIPGQRYARKLPGGKDFYWDTEKFERAQEKLIPR